MVTGSLVDLAQGATRAGRYPRAIGRTRAPARDQPYSTRSSMYSKLELVASATSVTQMRPWPVLSGPLPGDATAVEVTAWLQLVARGAAAPQLVRENVR